MEASSREAASPISEQRLRRIIAKARNPEHLDQLLAREAVNTDPAAYRELLERALFAADVLGYVKADKGEV